MDIILYTGFLFGLVTSLHCVGMCGPIALALPLRGENFLQKAFGGILYNFGRTITYSFMGAVFGLIGQGFKMAGMQRWISIAVGALMILSVLIPGIFRKIEGAKILGFTSSIRKGIQKLFTKKSYRALFFIGILNGWLPCGMVYAAIAGAIATGTVVNGVLYMALFGLGTLPMLLFISLIGNMVSISLRKKFNKAIPYLVVAIGIIFILRGLSLGIPFLSPPEKKLVPEAHMSNTNDMSDTTKHQKGSCCHK